MNKTVLVPALLLLAAIHSPARAIDSALSILATKFPEEKIFIHYDKEYYITGETIWFKAYLYSIGAPSGLSSNFYLQLTDEKAKIISDD